MTKRFRQLMPLFVLPLTVEVTRHMDQPLQWPHRWGLLHVIKDGESSTQCRHVLQSTWCAGPVCIQQPYTPGMTCLLDHAWPTFCIVHVCRFCFMYCGLRFYAQSHSDNCHVPATAPCFAHALAQARPTMSCIPLHVNYYCVVLHS